MVGLGGNDTYIVDDLADVIIEAAGAGADDTVATELAAFSLELIANVENLNYTGVDADPFVGTGNALNNEITGGDLDDTLSGLGGDDTLKGGLGADSLSGGDGNDELLGGDDNDTLTGGIGADELDGGAGADNMTGGDGNDIYEVDDAGDVVVEAAGASSGTDRVDSSITYVLGANVENLTLTGNAAINGTGNDVANVINGNGGANQLFGGGDTDTLSGGAGNDLLDGGTGNDTLAGGDNNDTIIGGAGNDTIDVGGGFNTIVYNAPNFGADTINSFDADGGTPANQDRIDLSAFGITAANFATRVIESTVGGAGNTLLTSETRSWPRSERSASTASPMPTSTSTTSRWRRLALRSAGCHDSQQHAERHRRQRHDRCPGRQRHGQRRRRKRHDHRWPERHRWPRGGYPQRRCRRRHVHLERQRQRGDRRSRRCERRHRGRSRRHLRDQRQHHERDLQHLHPGGLGCDCGQ